MNKEEKMTFKEVLDEVKRKTRDEIDYLQYRIDNQEKQLVSLIKRYNEEIDRNKTKQIYHRKQLKTIEEHEYGA